MSRERVEMREKGAKGRETLKDDKKELRRTVKVPSMEKSLKKSSKCPSSQEEAITSSVQHPVSSSQTSFNHDLKPRHHSTHHGNRPSPSPPNPDQGYLPKPSQQNSSKHTVATTTSAIPSSPPSLSTSPWTPCTKTVKKIPLMRFLST